MRPVRTFAAFAAAGIVAVGTSTLLTSGTAAAWHVRPSVEATCNGTTVRFVVHVDNTETDPAKAMTVTATDLQTGKVVSLGSVAAGHSGTGAIDTGLTTVKAGAIRFAETWTSGPAGTDQRRVEYPKFGCDPPPAVPDGLNGVSLLALGVIAVPVVAVRRRRRCRAHGAAAA
jgi:hypothetical protein